MNHSRLVRPAITALSLLALAVSGACVDLESGAVDTPEPTTLPKFACKTQPASVKAVAGEEVEFTLVHEIDASHLDEFAVSQTEEKEIHVFLEIEDSEIVKEYTENSVTKILGTRDLETFGTGTFDYAYSFLPPPLEAGKTTTSSQVIASVCLKTGQTQAKVTVHWQENEQLVELPHTVLIDCIGESGEDPGQCQPQCNDVLDCCDYALECPGPWPDNWACVEGFCVTEGCTDDAQCQSGDLCVLIDGVGYCVLPCKSDADCEIYDPEFKCSGAGDKGVNQFCDLGLDPDCTEPGQECFEGRCDADTGKCVCDSDADCLDGYGCK